jgi:hypothetical protein
LVRDSLHMLRLLLFETLGFSLFHGVTPSGIAKEYGRGAARA